MDLGSRTSGPREGSRRSVRVVALGAAVLGCLVTAACSATAGPQPGGPSSSNGSSNSTTAGQGQGLPIDAYLWSFDQYSTFDHAQQILVKKCMGSYGFDYQIRDLNSPPVSDRLTRRYGITDLQVAQAYGFHVAGDGSGEASDVSQPQSQSPAFAMALTGGSGPVPESGPGPSSAPTTINGASVPPGGCLGEARRTLAGTDSSIGNSQIARTINTESWVKARADRRVVAAAKDWQACMKARGFSYRDPIDAGNDAAFANPQPTEREILTAVASVQCSAESKLASIWYKVEVEIQTDMISRQQLALDEVLQSNQQALARAATIVGAG